MSVHLTAATAVMQYLPPTDQQRVYRMVERLARRDPRFRGRLDAAKARVEREAEDYEDWLVRQAEERSRYLMEDVP
ncbi:MAG TPA: hypothetical protein PLP22_07910 [Candidatus Competibacter sp.]|nr:hypothetical protein [Candidatus Competibacteraceae bacterium]HRE54700.1 hypothetical protein [Candidatus Competibacter sp.]HUM93298.1 hypothetical protein [Candidatus Competibacter sp.]